MTIKMADGSEKATVIDSPTYFVAAPRSNEESVNKGKVQKKHVLIGVSLVVVAGLVLAAILIGMHMFSQTQKDIIQFSLNFKSKTDGEDMKQDVEADPNDNVVKFHVNKNGQDVTIVNDFNRDIQVVRLETAESTNCYVSPLNRTAAMDPSQINDLQTKSGERERKQELFTVSNTPVADRSFLPKKAADMCQGVSVYWAYRSCQGQQADPSAMNKTLSGDRQRRDIWVMQPYYGLPGLGGCCYAYYACAVQMTETIQGIYHTCETYVWTGTCCGAVAYPYCQNWYYGHWYTPGLAC
jgi:hypothetical protein